MQQLSISSNKNRMLMALLILAVIISMVLSILGMPMSKAAAQSQAVFRVDANGNITKNGTIFRVKGASWFGLQGRYEPATDAQNPRGAPMEQYMGNVFWAPSGRTYDSDIAEFVAMGINTIRIPVSHQTFNASDPQGSAYLKNHDSVKIANSRLALETVAKKLDAAGISVLWDIHSCSNYVDWRKGRLDARPPYVDSTRDLYDYKREDSSCAASGNPASVTRIQAYNTSTWLADLQLLAGFSSSLGLNNVIGIDIFNEPWDYSWAEWKSLAEQAYTTINATNPNILVFVQGISASYGNQDGSPTTIGSSPHGSDGIDPNWGENLFEAGTSIPNIPKTRLVYSPHAYGPSVFVGKQFMNPAQSACVGKEGDEAGDLQCGIVINPTLLRTGWDSHFGYLKAQGYAIVIGEFGGNMDWPHGTATMRDQNRFGYLNNDTYDLQWQQAFRDYLIDRCILDTVYWSVNPESGDTGGIYTTPYRAGSNEGGWGTWGALDSRKISLLNSLWNANPTNCSTVGPTATPGGPTATRTNTPVGPTVTATRTATRTNTPTGPTLTPTRTATRTNTPSGPTATPSRTATRTNTPVGPTATRTNTPVAPTATPTSGGGGGTCSPVSSTITAPFTFDGVGNFCWQSTNLGGYINSWNTTSVTINGVNISNLYMASGSYPAKIGGFWYVTYNGPFAWSHFEAK
jgi:endoglucanase